MIALADESATEALGCRIGKSIRAGDFIALDGELGAGKTSLVRGIARGLGIDPLVVTSPTFVTMQVYSGGRMPLVHIDVWRLKDCQELETIGWNDLIRGGSSVIIVEWAQKIEPALPNSRLSIRLQVVASVDGLAPATRAAYINDQRDFPPT